jgi:hypothetical protein
MNHDLLTEFIACHSMGAKQARHRPPLEILAEIRAIEQEILQGIEELEGMLR